MDFVKDNTITEILKLIAPGTKIREGLENILKAKTGGLIVIGDTKEVLDLVDGGFNLNVDYTPSRLYELAKMDGAIVLSADLKKILYANAQLIPSPEISTNETRKYTDLSLYPHDQTVRNRSSSSPLLFWRAP